VIANFKTGWCLIRTTKREPMGYIGYIFTLYEKDDVTVKTEIRAKTASRIWYKIVKLMKGFK